MTLRHELFVLAFKEDMEELTDKVDRKKIVLTYAEEQPIRNFE